MCSVKQLREQIQIPGLEGKKFESLNRVERQRYKRYLERESTYADLLQNIREKQTIDVKKYQNCTIHDYDEFQRDSEISLCVYEPHENNVVPIYLTKYRYPRVAHLLLIKEVATSSDLYDGRIFCNDGNHQRSHYVAIFSLDRFLGQKSKNKKRFCHFCMKGCNPLHYDQHVLHCQVGAQLNVRFFTNPNSKYCFKKLSIQYSQYNFQYLPQ